MVSLGREELDKIFCMSGKKYKLPKLLLKAIATCESGLNQSAYRYEREFWKRYLENNPEWKDKDPAEVSASWGICQIMMTTAYWLGFRGTGEELCNPVYNIDLCAKLVRILLDEVIAESIITSFCWLSPLSVSLARYNGGKTKNPNEKGILRNQKYVNNVLRTWEKLKVKEDECVNGD